MSENSRNGGDFGNRVIVNVTEMARMVQLSRARFHELVNESVFPPPVYDIKTRRPFYTEELQAICLRVRRSNCGADGKAVAFNAQRRKPTRSKAQSRQKSNGKREFLIKIVNGLKSLGLKMANVHDVETVIREAYPDGTAGIDPSALVTSIFLELKRREKG
jgi:hypothetical protein